jgi:hypothetical protein
VNIIFHLVAGQRAVHFHCFEKYYAAHITSERGDICPSGLLKTGIFISMFCV